MNMLIKLPCVCFNYYLKFFRPAKKGKLSKRANVNGSVVRKQDLFQNWLKYILVLL